MPRKSRLGQTDDQPLLPGIRSRDFTEYEPPWVRWSGEGASAARAWAEYQKMFDKYGEYGPDDLEALEKKIPLSFYMGSVLGVKPDPLGRFILMDLRIAEKYGDLSRTILSLTGAKEQTIIGSVYYSPSERSDVDSDYIRQHGGPGMRVEGAGLGVPAYTGSTLLANIIKRAPGTFSPTPDNSSHNRTPEADKIWNGLVKHGTAYTVGEDGESDSTKTETDDDYEHCISISRHNRHIDYYTNDYGEVPGVITSDEVCGKVSVDYEIPGNGEPENMMEGNAILKKTPCFVWPTTGYRGRRPTKMDSRWVLKSDGTYDVYSELTQAREPYTNYTLFYDHYGVSGERELEGLNYPKISKVTGEMLSRAYHGGSPDLIFDIAIMLSKYTDEDRTIGYLRRLDIANAMQAHPEKMERYLELLGQRRLPGVGRVSLAGINEVRSVHRAVRLGQLKADPNSDNPLMLPPLSKKTYTALQDFSAS